MFAVYLFLQLTANHPSCGLNKDAMSSSFKSILRQGEFNIEKTRIQRSEDSGVVDDVPPEAPSPSSTISSASSSSNLSTGLAADSSKPTIAADNAVEKPSIVVSGDKTPPADDSKPGSKSVAVNPVVKSSVISTPLNVVENSTVSTPMSLAVTGVARSQLTRNIVVVVKSTTPTVTDDDDDKGSAVVQNVSTNEQAEQPKNRSPRNATLTPASISIGGPNPIQVLPASTDTMYPSKTVVESNCKRRQQSVEAERRVSQNSVLRRMESSPCNLDLTASASASPAAKETSSPQVSSPDNAMVTNVVVPRSQQPVVMKLTVSPSTPVTLSSQHITVVASRANTRTPVPGPISCLAVHAAEQSERVPSSHRPISNRAAAAARQRHRTTPVQMSNNISRPVTSSDTSKQALSNENSKDDKPDDETSKLKTDLTDGEHVSKVLVLPSTTNADVPVNAVVGRVKQMSTRDEHMTPMTSSCLVSEKPSRKPTALGIASRLPQSTPQADEHTGPVISDVFESLRRRQEQEAAAAAALPQDAKITATVAPGLSKSRQQPTQSARSKTGRSSVVSVTARSKHPPSRQPSAAITRCKKPKTPTSHSTVGINAKTPRGGKSRKDCATRVRRKRSKSSTRKEESEVEPEVVAGASDVTLIGGIGWQIATKCEDVSGVRAVAKLRYKPSKNDKTEDLNVSDHSKSIGRSRMSHIRTTSFEMPSLVPEQVCDTAGSRKDDVFTCEISAANTKLAASGKHKRSTSTSDAEHRGPKLSGEAAKDQRGNRKYRVPELTNRLSQEDGSLSNRLSSRRKSLSTDAIFSGDDMVALGVSAEGILPPFTAAADERHSGSRNQPPSRQSGELPICCSELGRDHDAEVTAAIDEIMRPQMSRRSRPGHGDADAGIEQHGDGDKNDHDGVVKVNKDQNLTGESPVASTTSVVEDEQVEDSDKDVDRSPRFVRKHDSLVALSCADDSRRPSVEKAQGGLGTLDGDITLSWHNNNNNNSFFDNTITANDMVSKTKLQNLLKSVYFTN